jgi:uncharacterized protein YgfB (UPF0149 family)
MHPTVTFEEVARALAAGASTVHAAEAHGCLCGALCVRRDYPVAEWLDEILADATAAAAVDPSFAALHGESVGVLERADMEFAPLMPDDDTDLATRVESLAAWCQGFLYGFGAAGTASQVALPPDVTEILGDLAQIANAGAGDGDAADDEEAALVELVEFVRAAVQLVYDELAGLRAGQPVSQSGH